MRLYRTLFSQSRKLLEEKLDYYSQFNPSPLSVKQFTDFGQKATKDESFQFLRQELPVRLANIMKEFRLLPDHMRDTPSLMAVRDLYRQSFTELVTYDNTDNRDGFTAALVRIRDRHKDVVMQTAASVMELKEARTPDANLEANIQYFLDRFYMSRISIRMLINQHTLLFGAEEGHGNHIGCIDPECDITRVIEDAYSNARFLCDRYYLACPELRLLQHNETEKVTVEVPLPPAPAGVSPISVPYVPSHLYHMLFELFKNAMRAVVEHHGPDDKLPPLSVLLVKGKEDLCIKLSDQGGGIPRSQMELLFNYMYSTAPQVNNMQGCDGSPPLAGYGYGLPLSRLYARYFQGDLTLNSVEGFGTDAIIYLKAISSEANELLPIYNKTCQRQYSTPLQTNDWSSQVHSSMFIRPFSTNTIRRINGATTSSSLWRSTLQHRGGSGSSSGGSVNNTSVRDAHCKAAA